MLDLRYVVDHLDEVRKNLSQRGAGATQGLDEIERLASERKAAITEEERLARELNEASASMAKVKDKKSEEFAAAREALRKTGDEKKVFEQKRDEAEAKIRDILLRVPNVLDPSVPPGASDAENPVVRTWGEKPAMDFKPREHHEIGTDLGILDFERAGKISGPRFTVLWGAASHLVRALVNFMLDLHVREHGYTEVYPPFMVKDTALIGTGNLPKFEEDLFKIQGKGERAHDLYLIPTAEVPVTNLHAGEILDNATLPRKYVAYTPCFRAEAGAAGRDTHGIIRQHQFDKVELVRLERPGDSDAGHEELTRHAEAVLQKLGLHYRTVLHCTGDMTFSSTKSYDLEVWLPGQNAYREISSCSNFGDFQARRAEIKYRPADEKPGAKAKPKLLHTLNGSALAVGRTLVAIMEQYQQADGTVIVPEALRPYAGGLERVTRRA